MLRFDYDYVFLIFSMIKGDAFSPIIVVVILEYYFCRIDTANPPHGAIRSFSTLLAVTFFFVMV